MQETQINLMVVKPEGELFEGQCTSVSLPGKNGMLEAMYGHEPMIIELVAGVISIKTSNGECRHSITVDSDMAAVAIIENTEVRIILSD